MILVWKAAIVVVVVVATEEIYYCTTTEQPTTGPAGRRSVVNSKRCPGVGYTYNATIVQRGYNEARIDVQRSDSITIYYVRTKWNKFTRECPRGQWTLCCAEREDVLLTALVYHLFRIDCQYETFRYGSWHVFAFSSALHAKPATKASYCLAR